MANKICGGFDKTTIAKELKLIVSAKVSLDDYPTILGPVGVDSAKLHVTMAFMPAAESQYIPCDALTGPLPSRSPIMAIEYWEGADVTVAVLNERDWKEARQVYDSLGLLYTGYEFRPHVTIAKGNRCNEVEEYEWLVGHYVQVDDVTIKLKEF